MSARKPEAALAMVREAAALNPQGLKAQRALGDIAVRLGHKDEARVGYLAALEVARRYEPEASAGIIADLEAKLNKL
jgi:Flp pilus assembly protein TadD